MFGCVLAGTAAFGNWALPASLAAGNFHRVAVDGTGRATVERQWLGRRTLLLSDMRVPLNLTAEVRLIAADDAFDDATAEDTVHVVLGGLGPGYTDAAFPLNSGLDIRSFRAVVLWSNDLQLNLMTAPLSGPISFLHHRQ